MLKLEESISNKNNINIHEYLFGEDQSRYLIEINEKNMKEVCKILEKNGVFYEIRMHRLLWLQMLLR